MNGMDREGGGHPPKVADGGSAGRQEGSEGLAARMAALRELQHGGSPGRPLPQCAPAFSIHARLPVSFPSSPLPYSLCTLLHLARWDFPGSSP